MIVSAIKKAGLIFSVIITTFIIVVLSILLGVSIVYYFHGFIDPLTIGIAILIPALVVPLPLKILFHSFVQLDEVKKELQVKNSALEKSLSEVKSLSGLLPICSNCKKIRDGNDTWSEVEMYVKSHSEADFSHSVCPECVTALYPDFVQNTAK